MNRIYKAYCKSIINLNHWLEERSLSFDPEKITLNQKRHLFAMELTNDVSYTAYLVYKRLSATTIIAVSAGAGYFNDISKKVSEEYGINHDEAIRARAIRTRYRLYKYIVNYIKAYFDPSLIYINLDLLL